MNVIESEVQAGAQLRHQVRDFEIIGERKVGL